ncbi:hypothetical protein GCM10022630_14250 [Thermobifida alba]
MSAGSRVVVGETDQGIPEGRVVKDPLNGTETEEELTVLNTDSDVGSECVWFLKDLGRALTHN